MAVRLRPLRGMTRPREVEPGKSYLTTRRCILRSFLLTPCDEVNQLFLYALGLYASQFGVVLHAVVVLGNHWHAVLTDVRGELPSFFQRLHGTIARALNCFRRRRDVFWEAKLCGRVELLDEGSVLDKMVYVAANPVAAGLVERGEEWPGLRLLPDASGRVVIRVEKPKFFFQADDGLPAVVEVVIERPEIDADYDDAELAARLEEEIEAREEELRAQADEQGRSFLGAVRVMEQDPSATPATAEPLGAPVPRFASQDRELRKRAQEEYRAWLVAYREALERWRHRERDVEFPPGTWWMRVFHRVECAEAEPVLAPP